MVNLLVWGTALGTKGLLPPPCLLQIERFLAADPITGGGHVGSAEVRLGIAIGTLLMCLLSLVQSVRLFAHAVSGWLGCYRFGVPG